MNGKADATAVMALNTRVTGAEGMITSQGSAIRDIENRIDAIPAMIGTQKNTDYVCSGFGIGIQKPVRQYVIVDGVTYINPTFIKENTL